jgi:hypothetical protein
MSDFSNGFRGTAGGAVQTNYTDQPGFAVAGMLAYASDNVLIDSITVGETTGVGAGRGVKAVQNTGKTYNMQTPDLGLFLPTAGLTVADFAGIVLFDEAMQSDELGNNGWAFGRSARVLRPGRAGGRVWVPINANDSIVLGTSTVNWVLVAGSDGLHTAGEFVGTALGGSATVGYSTAITTAKYVAVDAANKLAMIELG